MVNHSKAAFDLDQGEVTRPVRRSRHATGRDKLHYQDAIRVSHPRPSPDPVEDFEEPVSEE